MSTCEPLTQKHNIARHNRAHLRAEAYMYAEVGSGECVPGSKGGKDIAVFCSDANVRTKADCANKCTADKDCGGYAWDGPNVVCILYDYTPTKSSKEAGMVCLFKFIGGNL